MTLTPTITPADYRRDRAARLAAMERYQAMLRAEAHRAAGKRLAGLLKCLKGGRRGRAVMLMPEGRYFASNHEMARALGITPRCIRSCLGRRGMFCDGTWPEFADEPQRVPISRRLVPILRVSDGARFPSQTTAVRSVCGRLSYTREKGELARMSKSISEGLAWRGEVYVRLKRAGEE